jgi:hypothetical protein
VWLWLTAASTLLLILNGWCWPSWTHWPTQVWLAGGAFQVSWHPPGTPREFYHPPDGPRLAWSARPQWLFAFEYETHSKDERRGNVVYVGPAYSRVSIPLWPIIAACGLAAAWNWRLSGKFSSSGACPNCGYDRRGSSLHLPCPECGHLTPPAKPQ